MPRQTFPEIQVAEALSGPAREALCKRLAERNRNLRGATADDVIDLLDQHDSFLPITEPYWMRNGEELADSLHPAVTATDCVRMSARVAVVLLGLMDRQEEPVPEEFDELVELLATAAVNRASGVVALPPAPVF